MYNISFHHMFAIYKRKHFYFFFTLKTKSFTHITLTVLLFNITFCPQKPIAKYSISDTCWQLRTLNVQCLGLCSNPSKLLCTNCSRGCHGVHTMYSMFMAQLLNPSKGIIRCSPLLKPNSLMDSTKYPTPNEAAILLIKL